MKKLLPLLTASLILFAASAQAQTALSLPATDAALELDVREAAARIGLSEALRQGRLSVSLMDLSRPGEPRYAGLNDHNMMYAASLPKIAILLAGMEQVRAGELAYTPELRGMFTRLARFSSNRDASAAIQRIGFDNIARTLESPRYRLYDRSHGGGLWLGKGYGGPNDRWRRDPLAKLSHAASAAQTARFFWMMEQGKLVDPAASAEIKRFLSDPAIRHKFVLGLAGRPDHAIYRKSGTWRRWHSDAVLVESGDKKYIAVALMEDERGGEALPRLIRELDDLICKQASSSTAKPHAHGAD